MAPLGTPLGAESVANEARTAATDEAEPVVSNDEGEDEEEDDSK